MLFLIFTHRCSSSNLAQSVDESGRLLLAVFQKDGETGQFDTLISSSWILYAFLPLFFSAVFPFVTPKVESLLTNHSTMTNFAFSSLVQGKRGRG